MINILLYTVLILAGIAIWKMFKNYEEKEAEIIREYFEMKRKNGLR